MLKFYDDDFKEIDVLILRTCVVEQEVFYYDVCMNRVTPFLMHYFDLIIEFTVNIH